MEIERLLKSAAKGDERAWRSLAGLLGPKLERWFASHYQNLHAGELVQGTLIVVWQKLPDFEIRSEAAFMAWLFKVAHYVALSASRQRKREEKVAALGPALASSNTGPASYVRRAERLDRARRKIQELPNSLRGAIENLLAGGDARELAERAGIDWGTVRGYQSRAIAALQHELRTPTTPS